MRSSRKPKMESIGQRIGRELGELAQAATGGKPLNQLYTVRAYRTRRLPAPGDYSPRRVRKTREDLGVSQAVFADMLGVSASLVQSWEQGFRKPSRMACRLLDEISARREHWRGLLTG